MVYVISKRGKPLMPCTNVIARLLLKQDKAKVKRRCPFMIQLTYDATQYIQDCTLGVDTGSAHIGAAVVDADKRVLYMSETKIRNDITQKMDRRRAYRKVRRYRKARYRKTRWMNRKNSKRENRFSPTMVSKLHSHQNEIEFVKSILPITRLVIETGTFDCHLMKNPMLYNQKYRHWGYQQGPDYGFANTKAKVLNRDSYTCQCCRGKRKDSKLEVHHIVYRSKGGSNEEDNLITLCHTCHSALHHGMMKLKVNGKQKGNLRYATQMNSIRTQLLKLYPEAIETFGYVTKENLQLSGLPKTHCNDAVMIASGGNTVNFKTHSLCRKKCIPKGDYQQTKGIRSEQPLITKKIYGFRKFDKVQYLGKEYFIKGRMSTGYTVLMDIDGNKVDFSYMPKGYKTPKLKKCKRITARNGWMIQEIAI